MGRAAVVIAFSGPANFAIERGDWAADHRQYSLVAAARYQSVSNTCGQLKAAAGSGSRISKRPKGSVAFFNPARKFPSRLIPSHYAWAIAAAAGRAFMRPLAPSRRERQFDMVSAPV
jgi:hypothetical protein